MAALAIVTKIAAVRLIFLMAAVAGLGCFTEFLASDVTPSAVCFFVSSRQRVVCVGVVKDQWVKADDGLSAPLVFNVTCKTL